MKRVILRLAGTAAVIAGIFSLMMPVYAEAGKDFKMVVDEFGSIILAQDADSLAMDTVLQKVKACIDDSDNDTYKTVMETIDSVRSQFHDRIEKFVPYEPKEEQRNAFEKYDISYEELVLFDTDHISSLNNYILILDNFEEYLEYENEPVDSMLHEEFVEYFEVCYEDHEINKGYMGCGVNYWFAGIDEEEKTYLDEWILNKIVSFKVKDVAWDDTREAVEQRMLLYLDAWEKLDLKYVEEIGEDEKELLESDN